jgi:hypothetical protein
MSQDGALFMETTSIMDQLIVSYGACRRRKPKGPHSADWIRDFSDDLPVAGNDLCGRCRDHVLDGLRHLPRSNVVYHVS